MFGCVSYGYPEGLEGKAGLIGTHTSRWGHVIFSSRTLRLHEMLPGRYFLALSLLMVVPDAHTPRHFRPVDYLLQMLCCIRWYFMISLLTHCRNRLRFEDTRRLLLSETSH